MNILILTAASGTAHDSAAYALVDYLAKYWPDVNVRVCDVHFETSLFYKYNAMFYNWIQKTAPAIHKAFFLWAELEDAAKLGGYTTVYGNRKFKQVLHGVQPDCVISTHPHLNRGHFNLSKRYMKKHFNKRVACITCCTDIEGGFGFSRNWVSKRCDLFWCITEEIKHEVIKRGIPEERAIVLGPLLYPEYYQAPCPASPSLPKIVLAAGANGANNFLGFLTALLPLAGSIQIIALCGRSKRQYARVEHWAKQNPSLDVQPLAFQEAESMVKLYRSAHLVITRPGARIATEALLLGCPIAFNDKQIMPQERLQFRYFQKRGICFSVKKPQALMTVIKEHVINTDNHQLLKQRYKQEALLSNPVEIIDNIIQFSSDFQMSKMGVQSNV